MGGGGGEDSPPPIEKDFVIYEIHLL